MHVLSDNATVFKEKPYQLRKSIDYLNLFSEVNNELIQSDAFKKRRGKKTTRFPISAEFIEATECMEKVIQFFKDVKIISLSEVKSNANQNHDTHD